MAASNKHSENIPFKDNPQMAFERSRRPYFFAWRAPRQSRNRPMAGDFGGGTLSGVPGAIFSLGGQANRFRGLATGAE